MITNRDKRHLSFLRRHAIDVEPVRSARIAALVAIGNKVISVGHCQLKTDPLQARFAKNDEAIYLHAEVHAIKNALNHLHPDDLRKATLYVHRVKRPKHQHNHGGKWVNGMAKPCRGCMTAVETFDFKRVVYSTDGEDYEILER